MISRCHYPTNLFYILVRNVTKPQFNYERCVDHGSKSCKNPNKKRLRETFKSVQSSASILLEMDVNVPQICGN